MPSQTGTINEKTWHAITMGVTAGFESKGWMKTPRPSGWDDANEDILRASYRVGAAASMLIMADLSDYESDAREYSSAVDDLVQCVSAPVAIFLDEPARTGVGLRKPAKVLRQNGQTMYYFERPVP